jgi:hypothetical protein
MYADDMVLIIQAGPFKKLDDKLNEDLAKVHTSSKSWHLNLNLGKFFSIVFHLNNMEANRELNRLVDGKAIPTKNVPKYLDIKLDLTSNFKQHLEGVKDKLKTRNNIISKQAGTSRVCRANVLRISSLTLV